MSNQFEKSVVIGQIRYFKFVSMFSIASQFEFGHKNGHTITFWGFDNERTVHARLVGFSFEFDHYGSEIGLGHQINLRRC